MPLYSFLPSQLLSERAILTQSVLDLIIFFLVLQSFLIDTLSCEIRFNYKSRTKGGVKEEYFSEL